MVHALEKAASCLNSGGVILELHDLVEPPRIEVHSDLGEFFAGQLLSEDHFENEGRANLAINQVVAAGLLLSDRSIVFENYLRAKSFDSLSNWLEEKWPNEYIPEDTRDKVIDLESKAGENSEVVLRMISRLNLFEQVSKKS